MKYAILRSNAFPLALPSQSHRIPRRYLSNCIVLREDDKPLHPKLLKSRRFRLQEDKSTNDVSKKSSTGTWSLFQYAQRDKKRGEGTKRSKQDDPGQDLTRNQLISATLPRSPIMARMEQGIRPRKQQAKGMATRRLARNPWAKMLASPLRQCNATMSRLPRALLLSFSPLKDPEGAHTHIMPLNLADIDSLRQWKTVKAKDATSGAPTNSTRPTAKMTTEDADFETSDSSPEAREVDGDIQALDTVPTGQNTGQTRNNLERKPVPSPRSPALHLLPRRALLQHATSIFKGKGSTGSSRVNPKIIPHRWSHLEIVSRKEGYLWRQDMAELVTSLLKRRVITAVENVVQTGTDSKSVSLLIPFNGMEGNDLLQGAHTGAIIYLSNSEDLGQDVYTSFTSQFSHLSKSFVSSPDPTVVDFPAVQIPLLSLGSETSIPVFDMRHLLANVAFASKGQLDFVSQLEELLDSTGNGPTSSWWLLRSTHASSVQLLDEIWHLAQYTMFDSNFDEFAGVTTAADAKRPG